MGSNHERSRASKVDGRVSGVLQRMQNFLLFWTRDGSLWGEAKAILGGIILTVGFAVYVTQYPGDLNTIPSTSAYGRVLRRTEYPYLPILVITFLVTILAYWLSLDQKQGWSGGRIQSRAQACLLQFSGRSLALVVTNRLLIATGYLPHVTNPSAPDVATGYIPGEVILVFITVLWGMSCMVRLVAVSSQASNVPPCTLKLAIVIISAYATTVLWLMTLVIKLASNDGMFHYRGTLESVGFGSVFFTISVSVSISFCMLGSRETSPSVRRAVASAVCGCCLLALLSGRVVASDFTMPPDEVDPAVQVLHCRTLQRYTLLSACPWFIVIGIEVFRGRRDMEAREQQLQFLRWVSHECRSPLVAALLAADSLATDGMNDATDQTELVEVVRDGIQTTKRVLDESLTFLQTMETKGSVQLRTGAVDLVSVFHDAVTKFRVPLRMAGMELKVLMHDDVGRVGTRVTADNLRLTTVLGSLCSNALKYGGGCVTASLDMWWADDAEATERRAHGSSAPGRALSAQRSVVADVARQAPPGQRFVVAIITISDTKGLGFSPADAALLFQPFQQLRSQDRNKGTGLGLTLARSIVRQHGRGCDLTAHSGGSGMGSSWTALLVLPVAASPHPSLESLGATAATERSTSNQESGSRRGTSGSRVTRLAWGESSSRGGVLPHPAVEQMNDDSTVAEVSSMTAPSTSSDRSTHPLSSASSPPKLHVRRLSRVQSPAALAARWEDGAVLVVEDCAPVRKMLERSVERYMERCLPPQPCILPGAAAACAQKRVYSARDGVRGLKVLEEVGVDRIRLILLDSEMPAMTGPQMAEEARKRGYTGVIVGLTGNVLEQDVRRFEEAGADRVVGKPIGIEGLQDLLHLVAHDA